MNLKERERKKKNIGVALKAETLMKAEDDQDFTEQLALIAKNFDKFMKNVN